MTIFSLYIYDRHCVCIYYQDWHRTKRAKPAAEGGLLPGVSRAMVPSSAPINEPGSTYTSPRNTLYSASGVVVALGDDMHSASPPPLQSVGQQPAQPAAASSALPFDEEAKLVFGVIYSLRNMIKKLSGRDEQFTSYKTSGYRLHLFETVSGYKFVMLSDPATENLRLVLRQIYVGPFLEYVVRNPLMSMDTRERGIDNEYFRAGTDRLVRGLSVFG